MWSDVSLSNIRLTHIGLNFYQLLILIFSWIFFMKKRLRKFAENNSLRLSNMTFISDIYDLIIKICVGSDEIFDIFSCNSNIICMASFWVELKYMLYGQLRLIEINLLPRLFPRISGPVGIPNKFVYYESLLGKYTTKISPMVSH